MQTPEAIGNKPADETTYREMAEALALQGSIARDGSLKPETHADYAILAVDALIRRQAARGGAA